MKHIFIVNPVSGHGRSKKIIPWIHDYCQANGKDYEILMTEGKGHATQLAARYTAKDDVTVYACGGDGTGYEVLNGMQAGVPMAVIPSGTGNDFTRMFEYPKGLSLKETLFQTIDGKEAQVDIGRANQTMLFHNCLTMGLDAAVTVKAEKLGKKLPIPSKLVYIVSVFLTLKERKPIDLELTMDGKTTHHQMLLLAIMNGKFYGGGFQPTPDASVQDGVFDICLVDYTSLSRILLLLPKYMVGKHVLEREAHFYKCTSLQVKTAQLVPSQIDGEVKYLQEYDCELQPKFITVRVPQASGLN